MMSTTIAESIDGFHPTLKDFLLWNTIRTRYLFLNRLVREVEEEFGQTSERGKVYEFPRWRKVLFAILGNMLFYEIILGSLQFAVKSREVLGKLVLVNCKFRGREPKRTMRKRKLIDNL